MPKFVTRLRWFLALAVLLLAPLALAQDTVDTTGFQTDPPWTIGVSGSSGPVRRRPYRR